MPQKQPPEAFCKKNVFLEIPQNPQESTCSRVSFLVKLHTWGLISVKFLKTPFLQNTSGRLLLNHSRKVWLLFYPPEN